MIEPWVNPVLHTSGPEAQVCPLVTFQVAPPSAQALDACPLSPVAW